MQAQIVSLDTPTSQPLLATKEVVPFEATAEYRIFLANLNAAEPRQKTQTLLYAVTLDTHKFEIWTDSRPVSIVHALRLAPLSVQIHFSCHRSWRKKVGNRVFFRDSKEAMRLQDRLTWYCPRYKAVSAWGKPKGDRTS